MKHNTRDYEGAGPDASERAGSAHPDEQAGGTEGQPAHRATTQAERAVMHPEHHDAEWRYYHGAWHS